MFETIKSSRRWSWSSLYPVVASLSLLYVSSVGMAQEQKTPNSLNLERRDRFDGWTTLLAKTGRTETIHATIHQWVISGRHPVRDFPQHSFLLVQLRAGKVITVIDGKEERHVSSDFWVVPPKAKMSVQVIGETANLDVLDLRIPSLVRPITVAPSARR